MRIAVFHNRYRIRGGEDRVVDVEMEMLRDAGHEVIPFIVDNREDISGNLVGRIGIGLRAIWNYRMAREVAELARKKKIDVAHVHNFFPLLSPSVHGSLKAHGIPVVQTLHNYRMLCANGCLLRDNKACEECVTKGCLQAIKNGCYRGSRLQSCGWAAMTAIHNRLGSWTRNVDMYIALTEFARDLFVRTGLPREKISIKPNFAQDVGGVEYRGQGAVFVGRLSREKGVDVLIDAWRRLGSDPQTAASRLVIVGTGPEEAALRAQAADLSGVRFFGELSQAGVRRAISDASFLVSPSVCHETFGVTVVEAFSLGRPAIVSDSGASAELVEQGRTGLHFRRGDSRALSQACGHLLMNKKLAVEMGANARRNFTDRFTRGTNVRMLEDVYRKAIEVRRSADSVRRGLGSPGGEEKASLQSCEH